MPINLASIRKELFPGLLAIQGNYANIKGRWAAEIFNGNALFVPAAPYIWIPSLTLPEVVTLGAAATVIKNPEVTRRFWQGWFS